MVSFLNYKRKHILNIGIREMIKKIKVYHPDGVFCSCLMITEYFIRHWCHWATHLFSDPYVSAMSLGK